MATRVYTSPVSKAAHLLHDYHSPNSSAPALCGRGTAGLGALWMGTGNQTEYDEAARRPLCQHCQQAEQKGAG